MPGAMRRTMSQRTAPRAWCARRLDSDVKTIVAIEVAIAIFTASAPVDAALRQQAGQERHHQHAAADAEQPGQEAGDGAEREQLDDEPAGSRSALEQAPAPRAIPPALPA